MYSGDPRRPKNIVYYKHPQQEESTDMMQFLSMIFGICSLCSELNGVFGWLCFYIYLLMLI